MDEIYIRVVVVEFFCPTVRKLGPVHLVDPGYVKRVRGVAHAIRVSPQFANRMVRLIMIAWTG